MIVTSVSIIAVEDILIEKCWSYLTLIFDRLTIPFCKIAVEDILILNCCSYLNLIFVRVTSPFL